MTTPRAVIAKIDRQIDAIRAELVARNGRRPLGFVQWGNVRRRFPELNARENSLFRRRGLVQEIRDRREAGAEMRRIRNTPLRKVKCATCGVTSYAA